jgi:hypothetical protein
VADSYLYDLYYSNDPNQIADFYTHFNTTQDIIKWLKKMPSEKKREIVEIDGDNDIVVAMSTINADSKHAKEAVKLYKGQQIVFSQNADGMPQKYFNISKSYNLALNAALKHKPKYVILSNDDMIKGDDFSKLKEQIANLDKEYDTLFTQPHVSHSIPMHLSSITGFYRFYNMAKGGESAQMQRIMDRFKLSVITNSDFNIDIKRRLLHSMIFRNFKSFHNVGNFAIFSASFLKKNPVLFDPLCFNGYDDIDVSLNLDKRNNYSFVDFNIGALAGTSFGMDSRRWLRALVSHIYFDYKWKKGG